MLDDEESLLPPEWVCKACNADTDEAIVRCEECKLWFHQACVKYSAPIPVWKCPECKTKYRHQPQPHRNINDVVAIANAEFIRKQNSLQYSTGGTPKSSHYTPNHQPAVKSVHDFRCCSTGATPKTSHYTPSLHSDKSSVRLVRDLEIQRLEEEYAAKMNFIAKKYNVLSVCNSQKGSVRDMPVNSQRAIQSNLNHVKLNPNREVGGAIMSNEKLNVKRYLSKDRTEVNTDRYADVNNDNCNTLNVTNVAKITADHIASRKLIPRKLPTFSGNPKDWPMFISAYETSTHELHLSNAHNLPRLRECLKGEAFSIVEEDLQFPDAVPEVMKTLKQLYGRPDNIISAIMNKIRTMSPPSYNDMKTIIMYSATVRNLISNITAAGMSDHLTNQTMYFEVLNRLPPEVRIDFTRFKRSHNEDTNLAALSDYLSYLAEDVSQVIIVNENKSRDRSVRNKGSVHLVDSAGEHKITSNDEKQQSVKQTIDNKQNKCPACNEVTNHLLKTCERFKAMTVNKRWDVVVKNRLCRTCLKQHFKSKGETGDHHKCGIDSCDKWHHQLLHKSKNDFKPSDQTGSLSNAESYSHTSFEKSVMLRILPVTLHNGEKSIEALALLDDGSTISLLDDEIAQQLGLHGPNEDLCLTWTSNQARIEKGSMKTSVHISGSDGEKYLIKKLFTVESLSLPVQSLSAESIKKRFPHLANVPLSSYGPSTPRILIGIDQPRLGATLKIREGKSNEPIATKTRLGWVVCGPLGVNVTNNYTYHVHVCECDHDQSIHEIVKNNFTLENVGINNNKNDKLLSRDDERALRMMEATAKKTDKHYEIGLLFRYDNIELPDSYNMALKRHLYLERKMACDKQFAANVEKQIENIITKGYAKKLDAKQMSRTKRTWYLPIFVVTNANKPGKLRLVWDAAAKVDGVSLNSVLMKGPDMLCSLPSVLYAFRMGKYAVCGDIQEMYHQVKVIERDRECQRFLWKSSENDVPDEYEMQVLTFGAASSPTSAQFIKNKNASTYSEQFPRAAQAIIDKHYVDDYLDSFSSEEEAITITHQVKWIHEQGGFNMRHWISNSKNVMNSFSEPAVPEQRNLNIHDDTLIEKVLGMWWLPESDKFIYTLNFAKLKGSIFSDVKPTKRELLRFIMSFFDPLGLIACFLIHPKIVLQDVWKSHIGWDDQINDLEYENWKRWTNKLEMLKTIQIKRCYSAKLSNELPKIIQLHTFCDASEKAYSTVSYIRIEDEEGIDVTLIGARTKVAPINPISIPRLELQAAVLAARFATHIQQTHPFVINSRIFWCDSQVVLKWLHGNPSNYRQYVSFRIGELLDSTSLKEWRWVPSAENVADDATKWSESDPISSDARWFCGPRYLYFHENEWPGGVWKDTTPTDKELKIHRVTSIGTISIPKIPVDPNKYSSWHRLVRVNAWINRYFFNWKAKINNIQMMRGGSLLCHEIINSEIQLFRAAQWEFYSQEINQLQRDTKSSLERKSPIHDLSPIFDTQTKLLRINGRIDAMRGIDEFKKQPIILPREHRVTHLLLDSYHRQYLHRNFETTINEVRQKFFIPQLRMKMKSVRANCQSCKNESSKPNPPQMGQLPSARLATFSRPFTFVGVDFFGPMDVLVGRRHEKRYGALFTCMTIRAVHLEIAHSLSTDSFLLVLHSFMARRGVPQNIRCDNGTNFHGSQNELQKAINEIADETIRNHCMQIKWTFNPPASPHQGGVWEILVKSVKTNLMRVLPKRTPTDELLRGCLMEVETIINSRPLTYIPIESENSEAITPNHFLLGSSSGAKPAGEFSDDVLVLRKNWKISQQIGQHFWRRWILEYSPTLTRRTKWFDKVKPIEVGDIVVICDENQPRNHWPLGKILETKAGKDGQVRQATVQTKTGVYVRPAVKLAVLDVKDD